MDISDIFGNPIVWAFLAWLFSRIFTTGKEDESKKKKPENQAERPTHIEPRQNEHSRPSPRRNPSPRPNPRPTTRSNPKPIMTTVETKKSEQKPSLQTVQEAYEKLKVKTFDQVEDVDIIKEEPKKVRSVLKENIPKTNRNVKRNPLLIDQQKAVQGVIWSEILGPSRAKNPHYTRNRRHF
ncbi:hypothetical protein [Metabacillus litoralis]|uniref:hypothetical protein n=1 Tax=Metabacillus litoralis TaxID=152268 RepID=UPI001CFD5A31|nr:hypothetical protein [Metabacillus litoralis]